MRVKINFIIFLLLLVVICSFSFKLNVPRVLIPIFKTFQVKFVLESNDNGCLKWSIDQNDFVIIETINFDQDLQCSRQILIKSVSKSNERKFTTIVAEDVKSGQSARCDVILDVIKTLKITTTTKDLYLEDAPEVFQVKAYDNEGNCFTTLEGVNFKWEVVQLGLNINEDVVRFIKFKDSPYKTNTYVMEMENENRKGDTVLIDTVKTGTAKVIVKLPYQEYIRVEQAEVTLTVTAKLLIIPNNINMMIGDEFKFDVYQMKNGMKEIINLPQRHYHFVVEPEDIAKTTEEGFITTLKEGVCKLYLQDRNVLNSNGGYSKAPSTIINVVEPYKLIVTTLPHRTFSILISEMIEIAIEAYTKENKLIHLGSNVEGLIQVDNMLQVSKRSKNGTWLVGQAINEGKSNIKAYLHGTDKARVNIASMGELEVYPNIVVTPSQVVFPWDHATEPKFEVQLNAFGGDGRFLWSISNYSIGSVTQTGLVRTHSYGYFEVTAAMQQNHKNRHSSRIFIFPPTRLKISSEFVPEVEIGVSIRLPIVLYAEVLMQNDGDYSQQIPITRCNDLNFQVEISNENFIRNISDSKEEPSGGLACVNIAVTGQYVGSSEIKVSLTKNGKHFEDNVTVTAFSPLQLLHRSNEVILALGSSIPLVYKGGPLLLSSKNHQSNTYYKRLINVANEDIVKGFDLTNKKKITNGSIIQLTCKKIGKTEVNLKITKILSSKRDIRSESFSTVSVICENPIKLELGSLVEFPDQNQQCPMITNGIRAIAKSGEDIKVDVKALDSLGRYFQDVSSLRFHWDMNPKHFGKIHRPDGIFATSKKDESGYYINSNYQLITPFQKYGEFELSLTVNGYKQEIINKYKDVQNLSSNEDFNINDDVVGNDLRAIIRFVLLENVTVTPSNVKIHNNPSNFVKFLIKGGSGYYHVESTNDTIAFVNFNSEKNEVNVSPKTDGDVQLKINDVCLPSQLFAIVNVNVFNINIMRAELSDKIEIERSISCTVTFYDEIDNLIIAEDIALIELEVNFNEKIIKVRRLYDDKEKKSEIHFIITGLELGSTTLSFTLKSGSEEIRSAPTEIIVFPPFTLTPRNATLLIGSNFQIIPKGGPIPDCTIEYKIDNTQIADKFGILKGLKFGNTMVSAKAVGIHPTNGQKIIYSVDKIMIEVIHLRGINIDAPLTRFASETMIPIWATGLPENVSPTILASVEPPIRFEWTIDDTEVAEIHQVFESLGVKYGSEDAISIRLKGLKAGTTHLRLLAIMNGAIVNKAANKDAVTKAEIEVNVFETLKLTSPEKNVDEKLIKMAPFSSVILKTVLDGLLNIKYKVFEIDKFRKNYETTSLRTNNEINTLISASNDGIITSYGNFGQAVVVIEATDQEGLTQLISLVVEVKPVHYMMIEAKSNWKIKEGEKLSFLPLGAEFILKSVYYDNTGLEFTSGSLVLQVRNSRLDVAKISPTNNDTILISTKQAGNSVIKFWSETCERTADYIKLHVEQSIHPPLLKPLTLGDIMCLKSPLRLIQDGVEGKWSLNEKYLELLDNTKGIARIATTTACEVFISHDLHQNAPIRVLIKPPTVINTFEDSRIQITNVPLQKPFVIPLIFSTKHTLDRLNNVVMGWDCRKELLDLIKDYPFTCNLKFTNVKAGINVYKVLKVKPGFDTNRGQYVCIIESANTNYQETMSTLETNLIFWVEMPSISLKSDPVEFKFLPGIFVNERVVIKEKYFTTLSISGLSKALEYVKVQVNDPTLFSISLIESKKKNRLDFKIELLDYHPKLEEYDGPMVIKVESPLTAQEIKVVVHVDKLITPFSSLKTSSLYGSNVILVSVFTVVILALSIYAYMNYTQQVVNVSLSGKSLLAARSSMSQNNDELLSFKRSASIPLNIPSTYQTRMPYSPSCTPIYRRNNLLRESFYGESSNTLTHGSRAKRFI